MRTLLSHTIWLNQITCIFTPQIRVTFTAGEFFLSGPFPLGHQKLSYVKLQDLLDWCSVFKPLLWIYRFSHTDSTNIHSFRVIVSLINESRVHEKWSITYVRTMQLVLSPRTLLYWLHKHDLISFRSLIFTFYQYYVYLQNFESMFRIYLFSKLN